MMSIVSFAMESFSQNSKQHSRNVLEGKLLMSVALAVCVECTQKMY
jgi:hypothetical protein